MPQLTKEQLIAQMQDQLTKVQSNPNAPAWVSKGLIKRIGYLTNNTPITLELRLGDLQEQIVDVEADPHAPQPFIDSLKAQAAALDKQIADTKPKA